MSCLPDILIRNVLPNFPAFPAKIYGLNLKEKVLSTIQRSGEM